MKNENAYKGSNPIEKTAENAIIKADINELSLSAKRLARQLSPEQLREMINHYHKGA